MMRVGRVRDRGHADEKEHIRAKHPRVRAKFVNANEQVQKLMSSTKTVNE